ncbi:hypothetical protein STXM2123_572 [Streptomyces sp. F-3]|nr:hypothetical protein STXM2123_572 [Streptomyces sp. F-3]
MPRPPPVPPARTPSPPHFVLSLEKVGTNPCSTSSHSRRSLLRSSSKPSRPNGRKTVRTGRIEAGRGS